VLCTQTPGGVTEDEYVEMLLDRQVSGIAFVSGLHADTTADHERYRRPGRRKLPVGPHQRLRRFSRGAVHLLRRPGRRELAVSHLAALGHRRIGIISGPERFLPVQRKLAGFRATMTRLLGLTEAELAPLVSLSLFGVEGGPPPPAGCSTAASPASSAART
jgi:alanine racemase